MQKKPPLALVFLVVGIPAIIAVFLLWPRVQHQLAEKGEDNLNQTEANSEKDRAVDFSESTSGQTTTGSELKKKPPKRNANPVAVVTDDHENGSDFAPPPKQSQVQKAIERKRKELSGAQESFESLLDRTDRGSIEKFAATEWSEIAQLISLAQKTEDPSIAIEKYQLAENRLRELKLDIPNRESLEKLRQLLTQKDYGAFLERLSNSWANRPVLRDRLSVFWQEIETWDKENWFNLIENECFDLDPEDGGFADVYHAIADLHADLGDESGAAKSNATAWDHSFRITDPTRAAESGLRSVQRFAKNKPYAEVAKRTNKVSTELVFHVADPFHRMRLFSEIGRISRKPGGPEAIISIINKIDNNARLFMRSYWKQIYECRIYAETKDPSEIRALCINVPKYNGSRGFEPFSANTMTYAYAAVAAARTNNESAFWETMLLAEAQQLDDTGVQVHKQNPRTALVEADLRKGNVFRALVTAMNLSDAKTRAGVLLPILAEHPELDSAFLDLNFIQNYGNSDQGCIAVSKMFPTIANQLGGREKAIEWIFNIRQQSVKVAALVALARNHLIPQNPPSAPIARSGELDPSDFRELLRSAEADAALIQEGYDRAWAYLWIAVCWQKLDQPASYLTALEKSDDAIKSCWSSFWRNFTAPRNRGYKRHGVLREHASDLKRITNYYATLAEIQAFELNQPRLAVENVIYAARSTQPLNENNLEMRGRLWVVIEAICQSCQFRTRTLDSVYNGHTPELYYKPLLMSKQENFAGVVESLSTLQSNRTRNSGVNYITRVMAEAALVSAKKRDLNNYRKFRRMAMGNIKSQGALDSINLVLYQADAFAGELSLAKKGANSRDYLPIFGSSSKVAATLCAKLSLASRTEDAIKQLPPKSSPFYRIRAVHSVAACRSKSLPQKQLLEWVNELQLIDRVAAICGIAYPEPEPLD